MNLNPFDFNYFLAVITTWCFYLAIKSAKRDKKPFLKDIFWMMGLIFLTLLGVMTYHTNYIDAGYRHVARITLHSCEKDGKIVQNCEYIGAITYQPYVRELVIKTTPLYPYLNCPEDSCVQERIFVDKDNVKRIDKL